MEPTHQCVMCGGKQVSYTWPNSKLPCLYDVECRQYGNTAIPFSSTISFQQYQDMEQDMCNTTKRWGVGIEPGSRNSDGSDTYHVRFDYKDKNRTDQMTRSFDTFEDALAYINGQYEALK